LSPNRLSTHPGSLTVNTCASSTSLFSNPPLSDYCTGNSCHSVANSIIHSSPLVWSPPLNTVFRAQSGSITVNNHASSSSSCLSNPPLNDYPPGISSHISFAASQIHQSPINCSSGLNADVFPIPIFKGGLDDFVNNRRNTLLCNEIRTLQNFLRTSTDIDLEVSIVFNMDRNSSLILFSQKNILNKRRCLKISII
jgi:hypothetical protein